MLYVITAKTKSGDRLFFSKHRNLTGFNIKGTLFFPDGQAWLAELALPIARKKAEDIDGCLEPDVLPVNTKGVADPTIDSLKSFCAWAKTALDNLEAVERLGQARIYPFDSNEKYPDAIVVAAKKAIAKEAEILVIKTKANLKKSATEELAKLLFPAVADSIKDIDFNPQTK